MGSDWNEEARNHKIRRTAPLVDEHERPSAGAAKLRKWKKARPWKIEWRLHPREFEHQRKLGWWWTLWGKNSRTWGNYGAYKTENARDTALKNLQGKNQTYWQYRKKDPK